MNPTKVTKIGIDCRCFDSEGGTKVYAVNLIRNMISDKNFEFYLFYTSKKHLNSFTGSNVHEVVIPLSNKYLYFVWDQIVIPYLDLKYKIDMQHSPKGAVPILTRSKRVVTILDLTYILLPETVKFIDRIYWRFNCTLSSKLENYLVFISKSTETDFKKFYPTKNKSEVIYLGLGQKNNANIQKNTVADVILYTGSLEKRKNLPNLIRAFSIVLKQLPNLKLFLVGKPGWTDPEIESVIEELGIADKITKTGFVSTEELNNIYSRTFVYTYVSTYEGFGIPILEAMNRGVPVITTNVSSMPEVAGDAAIYVEPNGVEELAKQIETIYKNKDLRNKLIESGFKNVKNFSWEKCAEETLNLYKNL